MKFPPLVSILALALCASCATSPPAANPAAAQAANPPAAPAANPAAVPGGDPLSLPGPTLDTTISPTERLASQCKAALVAKDYAGAQAAAAAALRLDPEYEEVWVAYGMAWLRLGDADRARRSYERALAVHQARERKGNPDAGQAYEEIYLLLLLGRSADAEALLNRACAAFPNDRALSTLSTLFPEFKQNWEAWAVRSP